MKIAKLHEDGTLELSYHSMIETLEAIRDEDPKWRLVPSPHSMFSLVDRTPLDAAAKVLLRHGWDVSRLDDPRTADANMKVLRSAYPFFFHTTNNVFREPHTGAYFILDSVVTMMDAGYSIEDALKRAIKKAEKTKAMYASMYEPSHRFNKEFL